MSFVLFRIVMTKYTSWQVNQGDFDFDRLYHKRRQASLPYYTHTDHLFAAPSSSEQPDGEGSHQHTHLHHLCWRWTNQQSRGPSETGGVRVEGKMPGFKFDKFRGVPLYKTLTLSQGSSLGLQGSCFQLSMLVSYSRSVDSKYLVTGSRQCTFYWNIVDLQCHVSFRCTTNITRWLRLIPGSGRCTGEGNATHSSILAWRIPWTEDPVGL